RPHIEAAIGAGILRRDARGAIRRAPTGMAQAADPAAVESELLSIWGETLPAVPDETGEGTIVSPEAAADWQARAENAANKLASLPLAEAIRVGEAAAGRPLLSKEKQSKAKVIAAVKQRFRNITAT